VASSVPRTRGVRSGMPVERREAHVAGAPTLLPTMSTTDTVDCLRVPHIAFRGPPVATDAHGAGCSGSGASSRTRSSWTSGHRWICSPVVSSVWSRIATFPVASARPSALTALISLGGLSRSSWPRSTRPAAREADRRCRSPRRVHRGTGTGPPGIAWAARLPRMPPGPTGPAAMSTCLALPARRGPPTTRRYASLSLRSRPSGRDGGSPG
jgi:hypothetical protein